MGDSQQLEPYTICMARDEEEKLSRAREEMVSTQLRVRGIDHEGVLRAFLEIPRERFLPPGKVREAYADRPVPIGHGQTISQPYVVALMLQELAPRSDQRILDVGAGSGYQTVLLAKLAKHVYAVERIADLTERAMNTLAELNVTNVSFHTSDGSLGWPEEAPFDGIICGAGAPDVPQPWVEQLADGGRIVLPVGGIESQMLLVAQKVGKKLRRREICGVRFVKLIGREGWPDE